MASLPINKNKDGAQPRRLVPPSIAGFILAVDAAMFLAAVMLAEPIMLCILNIFPALHTDGAQPAARLNGLYYLIVGFCLITRFGYKGHYTRRFPWYSQVERILKTLAFFAILDAFIQYNVDASVGAPVFQLGYWLVCAALLLAGRYISLSLTAYSGDWDLPVVLVGNAPSILDCLYAFKADGHTGYVVKAILLQNAVNKPLDAALIPKLYRGVPVIDDPALSIAYLQENKDLFYILDMGELAKGRNKDVLEAVEKNCINLAVIPNVKFLDVYGMEPHYFFGNDVMILHRRDKMQMPFSRFCKRALDIFITFWALAPLLLITTIVWIAKKLEKSKTPIFYGGERLGVGGRNFKCWKFCTMRADGDEILEKLLAGDEKIRQEWNTFHKLKKDPRIDSKISAFLRKSSLDELPQLWNVFVGDMSLVGPRPLLESEVPDYGKDIKSYISVRPGITGLWQVSGRNETTFKHRVYWDGWYVRNWSLWHDIVILFKTFRVFVAGEGAY